MSRLPVAMVSVSSALGGSERVLLDLVAGAQRCGLDALVLVPKPGPLVDAVREAGGEVRIAEAPAALLELSQRAGAVDLPAFGLGLWRWSRAIARAVEAFEAVRGGRAVLYSNGFKAHLACELVRGRPRVWHLHEFPPERLGPLWHALTAALPDAIIAPSAAVGAAWRRFGAEPAVVPNGVPLERFVPAARTGWVHDILGLPAGARLVGMPAVFARWKGQLEVVDAFVRGPLRQVPEAHLVLAGGAIYDTKADRGFAEELVRRVGRPAAGEPALNDRIHFLKFQPDPWRLYPEFELVIHFSTRPEPFGRTILEAMACGVPVIASDAGGPVEIVERLATGWLVPMSDVEALAAAMVQALGTDLAMVGRAARRRAEEHYSAATFADGVSAVIRKTVSPAAGRTADPSQPPSAPN